MTFLLNCLHYYKLNVIILMLINLFMMKRIYFMKYANKKAQSLIEYGLILALVAVVAVTILGKFSSSINDVGNKANTAVSASADNALKKYCVSIGSTYNASTGQCN